MIVLSELVRMPKGTVQVYLIDRGDTESYLLKKLSTYALRCSAKVHHRVARIIYDDSDEVRRMVVCTVLKQGKKLKKRGRK